MEAQKIRELFLDFFEKKNHKIVKSSSLYPKDDQSLLFTNAGMNQFKNIFLGLEKRSYTRSASVQKCLRVSGKHNDLEQVGKTNKHHTFFEMLGNFSFGDYFKKAAIEYAWQLVTEVFKMEKDALYITVYNDDDEAFQIWSESIGISEDRIFRFGKKDNYWAMGETGPCGPCSEIHYDLGQEIQEGDPYSLIEAGSDRFLELWNLVFMQYYQDEKGQIHSLPSPSIDTGMGLERVAAILQGKKNNYDTDLFLPLIETISNICSLEYPSNDDNNISMRIIADHIRAISFLLIDGIMPSNDGRGYVLRRLIRRAFRRGNVLGIHEPFLYKLVGVVSDIMKDAYPELLSSSNYVSKICLSEEKRFSLALSSGILTFNKYIADAKESDKRIIPGTKLFKLYDTYGFPLDLSQELAEEENIGVDKEGFFKEMDKQRQRARLSWKGETRQNGIKTYGELKNLIIRYIGYEDVRVHEASVLAMLKEGKHVKELKNGDSGEVFLSKTPFYAEAGGQVGDSGILKNPHFSALVETTYYPIPNIISHKVKVISGMLKIHDTVEALVDVHKKKAISLNHTATHLLHASLRQILGDHIKQAGSLVSAERFRFDFTHFSSLNNSELRQVEFLVNEKIRENIKVKTRIVSLEEGIKEGAIAIFEEKYQEKVRMVTIGCFSKELCGGVHIHNTGEIGLFKIISETSVAAGMRRIEAVTGEEALKYVQETHELLLEIQNVLNSPRENLTLQIGKLMKSLKQNEKESKSLRQKLANFKYGKKDSHIQKINGISVIIQKVEGLNDKEVRELADSLKQKIGSGIIILGAATEEKVFLVSVVTKDLTVRIKADDIIRKIAPMVDGGGGGRPDFAQAEGIKVNSLNQTLKKCSSILEEMIK